MTNKLVLNSLSSAEVDLKYWKPNSNQDIFICLDLEISFENKADGSNLFYVTLASPEALRIHRKGIVLVKNKTLVVKEFDYEALMQRINEILCQCTRNTWEESCTVLQKYFSWEYEDYSMEGSE
ncbi:MAG: hypothetical protein HRT35_09630 [Algicola sp.]|nr:hypothetical protein [Algicola sp.]